MSKKHLILDVSTRWNATYAMLSSALEFKEVFVNYADRESSYNTLPSSEEWKKVEDVCSFNEATNVISGSEYPTSNLFLIELYVIKEALDQVALEKDSWMKNMAGKMKNKFDKYWGSCNLLISIGAILDPRYKMELINLSFKSIYSEDKVDLEVQKIEDNLEKLFQEYVMTYKEKEPNVSSARSENVESGSNANGKGSSFISSRFGKGIKSGSAKYNQHIRSVDCVESAKSELKTYLEGVCIPEPGEFFDALGWWKANKLKYRILSKMAADILAIPITTVASESAFSAGGRVIDPHRSALGTKMVDTLICGADWYRRYYGLHNKKKKENVDVVYVELP
ncbi:hypothetical protein QVD17_28771 [Tagetes erecta]|uniref:Zinc finger BED domain-containing protein RICESLEEPER 2-like n=1 Tax=Tagetes erecta TaxID=13708 RepID=A0AAD8KB45_TARER|nr:hypothetical protein QVD17_28771 [Tagetes erecta]